MQQIFKWVTHNLQTTKIKLSLWDAKRIYTIDYKKTFGVGLLNDNKRIWC